MMHGRNDLDRYFFPAELHNPPYLISCPPLRPQLRERQCFTRLWRPMLLQQTTDEGAIPLVVGPIVDCRSTLVVAGR